MDSFPQQVRHELDKKKCPPYMMGIVLIDRDAVWTDADRNLCPSKSRTPTERDLFYFYQ